MIPSRYDECNSGSRFLTTFGNSIFGQNISGETAVLSERTGSKFRLAFVSRPRSARIYVQWRDPTTNFERICNLTSSAYRGPTTTQRGRAGEEGINIHPYKILLCCAVWQFFLQYLSKNRNPLPDFFWKSIFLSHRLLWTRISAHICSKCLLLLGFVDRVHTFIFGWGVTPISRFCADLRFLKPCYSGPKQRQESGSLERVYETICTYTVETEWKHKSFSKSVPRNQSVNSACFLTTALMTCV